MPNINEVLDNIDSQEEKVVTTYTPFEVNDLKSAVEASRRIAYFEDKKTEIDDIAQAQIQPYLDKIEKIKEWSEQEKEQFNVKQNNYKIPLELYLRSEVLHQLAKGKKPKKSIKTPYGTLKLTKQQPEFIKDDEQLFTYAKSNGFVKIKESTDWSALKKSASINGDKLVSEDGEVIPGVTVKEREDKFELKLNK